MSCNYIKIDSSSILKIGIIYTLCYGFKNIHMEIVGLNIIIDRSLQIRICRDIFEKDTLYIITTKNLVIN